MATEAALLTIMREEARIEALARDLQYIGQVIGEIISSTTMPYAKKRCVMEYWMARKQNVSQEMTAANDALAAAYVARTP